MQSYTIGTVAQITKLIKQGGWGAEAGKTPAERWNARKATMQLAAVQFGLAGVMGMPFVGGAMALLNQGFPQLELNKNLRGLVSQLFGEDEEHDNVLSDLAMSGVPSMFGWDFQSRLSMGNTVPGVSEINGFQSDILTGAPVNLVTKFVQGGKKIIGGDYLEGAKDMMPASIKKITTAIADDGKVRDYQGRPIPGGDRTWGELTGQVLGFQPTRLTQTNAFNRMKVQSETEHKRLDSQFNQDLGQNILDGNIGTVIQKLQDRAAGDDKYEVFGGARKAVDAAAEMYFPRDLRRELTKNDAAIARLMPVNTGLVSEVERAAWKDRVLRQIGVPMKPRDRTKYAIMDRLSREGVDEGGAAAEAERTGKMQGNRSCSRNNFEVRRKQSMPLKKSKSQEAVSEHKN
jgi:hypothetical protein